MSCGIRSMIELTSVRFPSRMSSFDWSNGIALCYYHNRRIYMALLSWTLGKDAKVFLAAKEAKLASKG